MIEQLTIPTKENGHPHQEAVFISASAPEPQTYDVSVLIPAYNAADTLERAIDSARQQTRVSVQVVICDDASTDATADVLATYWPYEYITVIRHDANQGQAAALNTAAQHATGRYFMELDADDWLEANSLAALVYALDSAPGHVGFAYGATRFHGLQSRLYNPPPFQRGQFYYGFVSMYAFLYRRDAWDCGCRYGMTYDAPDGRKPAIQDWDMALQLTEHMRYEARVVSSLLVLNHQLSDSGLASAIQAHKPAMLALFKDKWPMVRAEDL